MIEHLSAEQISLWMIGDRAPQLARHVAECDECRAELRQLEATLEQFRGSVREWSSNAPPAEWRQPAPHGFWLSGPRLALASATLLILVSLPVYFSARHRQLEAQAALVEDAQLLERVDSSISRAVPASMEPLVNLVTWNSAAEQNTKVERR